MRFSSRTVLTLLALIVPIGVSAMAVGVNLQSMIGIVQTNKKPLAFDLGMKGTYGKISGTISITGTQNGNLKSLAKAALDATIILDGRESNDSWGHAEFKTRLANETLYVRLEDFSAKGEWAAYINMVEPYVDVWYSFPIEPEEYEQFMKAQQESRDLSYTEIESLFKIVEEKLRNGKTRYTLTIPKNRQRRLLSRILGPGYSRYYRSARVDARLSVDTFKNVFDAFTGSFDLTATVNGEKSTLNITGSATTLTTVPVIIAPTESTSWKQFLEEYYTRQTESDVDPKRTPSEMRDTQRRADVNTILYAVYQYSIDHGGRLPPTLAKANSQQKMICKTSATCDGVSLDALIGFYLVTIPVDPSLEDDGDESGYMIRQLSNGRISVWAPLAEHEEGVSVTR